MPLKLVQYYIARKGETQQRQQRQQRIPQGSGVVTVIVIVYDDISSPEINNYIIRTNSSQSIYYARE